MFTSQIALPKSVTINVVDLRDGIQNESYILSVDEKIDLLESNQKSNIKVIIVGSFVDPKSIPQMANTIDFITIMPRKETYNIELLFQI